MVIINFILKFLAIGQGLSAWWCGHRWLLMRWCSDRHGGILSRVLAGNSFELADCRLRHVLFVGAAFVDF